MKHACTEQTIPFTVGWLCATDTRKKTNAFTTGGKLGRITTFTPPDHETPVVHVHEARMMNEPKKHWTRWPLAVWEGLLFGWFLFVIYIAAMTLDQAADFFWREMPSNRLPRMTIWVRDAIPDELWSLYTGWVTGSVGFGLICFSSKEALSSRIFRWFVVAALTMFLALAIPIMAQFKLLSGRPDDIVWDEILCVCLGLAMLATGVMQVRSASSSS